MTVPEFHRSNLRHDIESLPYPVNVFALWVDLDNWDDLLPNVPHGSRDITVSFLCSDFFHWGTADSQGISPDDWPLLLETARELEKLDEEHLTSELFCARKRAMRPQGAWLAKLASYAMHPENVDKLMALFEACGPSRAADLWNPVKS